MSLKVIKTECLNEIVLHVCSSNIQRRQNLYCLILIPTWHRDTHVHVDVNVWLCVCPQTPLQRCTIFTEFLGV